MKAIRIIEDRKLAELKHAAPAYKGAELRDDIKKFRKSGYEVRHAEVRGDYVPNKYQFTMGMKAPGFMFDGRNVVRFPHSLQCRSFGRGPKFHYTLISSDGKVPSMWRCIRRVILADGRQEITICG